MSSRARAQQRGEAAQRRRLSPQTSQHVGLSADPTRLGSTIQRAHRDPHSLTRQEVHHLQRSVGNRAVGRLLTQAPQNAGPGGSSAVAQRKPASPAAGMPVERQVGLEEEEPLPMQQQAELEEEEMPLQRRDEDEELTSAQRMDQDEEEPLQGKFPRSGPPVQRQGSGGQGDGGGAANPTGMPAGLRAGLEALSGSDLSGVRVHYNSSKPAQVNALAYTQGQDIHVSPGQEKHLPHEGWHAVQQMQGRVKPTRQAKGVSINDDKELEREADVMGAKALQMKPLASAPIGVETLGAETVQMKAPDSTSPGAAQVEDPNRPVFDAYKGASVNKIGHVSAPANQYSIAKSRGVNVRAKPDGTLPAIARVKYDTEVQVRALDNTSAFYFIIAKTGVVGWINKDFVVLDPPDVGARLHHITEENLTTILKNEYIDKNLWTLSTGNDYTTLAAAVVVANEGRKGVSANWKEAQRYRRENTLKRVFDPWMIDNFAIYHGSKILKGHNIWLPSPRYIRLLQSSGVIGSRPGWINTAVDIGKGIAGFFAGVVSGIFGSLWDTLTGLWELGKGIVSAVKSALDGSLFASIESIYDSITNMTWEDFKNMVNEVITMGKEAFDNFKRKWEHPDTYKQWHFRGYVIGAIALEIVLAVFTGGATLGAKVLAKIGKYFPKLMRVLNKLLALADKLPGRRRRRDRRRDKDRDRDEDRKDLSGDDRAWEQARVMAALVTEQHDLKDTPVKTLIPLLNATIAARFKGVSGYRARSLGRPHTYKIVQFARRKDVDNYYTEEDTTKRHSGYGVPYRVTGPHNRLKGTSVYVIKDAQGAVLYVGKGGALDRLRAHIRDPKKTQWFGEIAEVEVPATGLTNTQALALEEDLIGQLKPLHNVDKTPFRTVFGDAMEVGPNLPRAQPPLKFRVEWGH